MYNLKRLISTLIRQHEISVSNFNLRLQYDCHVPFVAVGVEFIAEFFLATVAVTLRPRRCSFLLDRIFIRTTR